MRGPAIEPSLVTCPTMNVAQPVRFENSTSACVQSRTCPRLPAYDSDDGQPHRLDRVDDQRARRLRFEPVEHRAQVRLGEQRNGRVDPEPRRSQFYLSGRLLTAEIGHRAVRHRRAAICSNSVDFPAPGGPPMRVTLAGTIPPPERRVELGQADAHTLDVRRIDVAQHHRFGRPGIARRDRRPAGRHDEGRSSNEFHALQLGQRPSHRVDSDPQAEQA